ncbi:MAG: hypothetical protein QM741_11160 [Rudaea sp.]|uniref:hypothetical protein n=1 Tax=Rudaea sp. TaxID=2136325 RepID=UPI0039E673E9
MTDALFYELLTTDPITRARCFSKFPEVNNPVRIIGHIGPMLLHEQRTNTKALSFLSYEVAEKFRFNPQLRNAEYQLPLEARRNTDEQTSHIFDGVERYIQRINNAVSFFPLVAQGSDEARKKALKDYEDDLAKPETIIEFFRVLDDSNLPPPTLLSDEWATFRFYQVNLLFALHTLYRHRGEMPSSLSNRERTRLEHDEHDASLFVTAVMAGGLATKESKLIRWWHLLCPNKPIYDN